MSRILRVATLLVLVFCVTRTAVAQSTTEVVHKTGTVIAKYDGKILVKGDDGGTKEFKPAPGASIMVDGKPTTYEALRVGTVLSADFVKTTTTVPVTTTEIKNAKVIKVAGQMLFVEGKDGFKSYDVPVGFRFLVDGKEVSLDKIMPGMKLTATIVSKATTTLTESEIKNIAGVAPAAPAAAPAKVAAPAPIAAPAPVAAPAPAPAPEPAPAKQLPKTGSPLPLAALGGALSLLAGLGVRSFRRSN